MKLACLKAGIGERLFSPALQSLTLEYQHLDPITAKHPSVALKAQQLKVPRQHTGKCSRPT
ncbi:MAG: hypothetical protein CFE43_18200 [Burkholderiales bacterium PBB3]|nr:MAG: hypothetical protein CFE43_18200 [Burkholderiales bacterium PBB3]